MKPSPYRAGCGCGQGHGEPADLGVLAKRVIELRVEGISLLHDGLNVVRDHDREHPPKNAHAASNPPITSLRVCQFVGRRTCVANTPR